MKLYLISPEGILLDNLLLQSAIIPTKDGVITVLPWHSPLISALGSGTLTISSEKDTFHYTISGGIIQVNAEELKILAEYIKIS